MALGNLLLGTRTFTDTNDNGRYLLPSTSVVGETSIITCSRLRKVTRTRDDGSLVASTGFELSLLENIYSNPLLNFELSKVRIVLDLDNPVTSASMATRVAQLAAVFTEARITQIRNGMR